MRLWSLRVHFYTTCVLRMMDLLKIKWVNHDFHGNQTNIILLTCLKLSALQRRLDLQCCSCKMSANVLCGRSLFKTETAVVVGRASAVRFWNDVKRSAQRNQRTVTGKELRAKRAEARLPTLWRDRNRFSKREPSTSGLSPCSLALTPRHLVKVPTINRPFILQQYCLLLQNY